MKNFYVTHVCSEKQYQSLMGSLIKKELKAHPAKSIYCNKHHLHNTVPFEACNLQTVQVLWCLADLKNYEIRSGQSQAPKLLIITWLSTQLQEN